MREYREPTCATFLKEPLVLGVSLFPLLLLVGAVSFLQTIGLTIFACILAVLGYSGLRLHARLGRVGSEEAVLYWLERKAKAPLASALPTKRISFQSPDTLDEDQALDQKAGLEEELRRLRSKESVVISISVSPDGATCTSSVAVMPYTYSLYRIPSHTDPAWITAQLRNVRNSQVVLRIDGMDQRKAKQMAEKARRRNALLGEDTSSIDAEVSFAEASAVLEGICRGTEEIIRLSLIVQSHEALPLDPDHFCQEKNVELARLSVTGERRRPHRGHYLRLKTATDLIPSNLDPLVEGFSFLKTRRGFPADFSLVDERFDAHHALIVGSTGAGKSFFTGLSLLRLVECKMPVSVLFMDHRRSFKRLVTKLGRHVEPTSLTDLKRAFDITLLDEPGAVLGVELVELLSDEKIQAVEFLLEEMERFLAKRQSTHLVYLVIDECWSFLKEKPHFVQRAFREYRKLGGAIVAITHSIGDFLNTENGQVVLQTAPIRILLRQEEDIIPYRSALNINAKEARELRFLRQEKGVYSECLVKSPYHSLIARLCPTPEELELLHTDKRRRKV
jgi:hypothetical protein